MIRLIVKKVFLSPEGALLATRYQTYDIEHERLERLLNESGGYCGVSVVGAEVSETDSTLGD